MLGGPRVGVGVGVDVGEGARLNPPFSWFREVLDPPPQLLVHQIQSFPFVFRCRDLRERDLHNTQCRDQGIHGAKGNDRC